MPIIEISNKHQPENVWVDARFSNGGLPFSELESIEGFPRWMSSEESVLIEMGNWREVLYKCSLDANSVNLHDLHRIYIRPGSSFLKGFIWPITFTRTERRCPEELDGPLQHWFLYDEELIQIYQALVKRFGITAEQIASINTEMINGHFEHQFLLTAKVRKIRKKLIEPSLRLSAKEIGFHNAQIYVKITDLSSGNSGERMIIESLGLEALDLIESFSIKDGNLIAKPRRTGYSCPEAYRGRGFHVPITEPLKNFFAQ
ncbi:MAG: hypothetical protein K2X81_19795 [Candidatus Obscuribacterales bacterium]|nr:hypothetical protein [Candidatus Obscuribacterales bacterium]